MGIPAVFLHIYLRAGRRSLAWIITGLRLLILLPNFLFYPNATFAEISEIHRANLMKKLQVSSVAELVRIAVEAGLVSETGEPGNVGDDAFPAT